MAGLQAMTERVHRRYAGSDERPLGGYLAVLGAYAATAAGLAALGRVLGVRLPQRWGLGDTALLSAATFKASRLLSKDAVASPLRAPFTRYEGPAGEGELNESVRGDGAQHAAGELLSCPFCLSVWIATGLGAGMVFAPKTTRLVATVLTAVAGSDALHLLYDHGKKFAER